MWPSLMLSTKYFWLSAFQAHGRIAFPIDLEVRDGLETYFGQWTGEEVTCVSGPTKQGTKALADLAAQRKSFSPPRSLSRHAVLRQSMEDRWMSEKWTLVAVRPWDLVMFVTTAQPSLFWLIQQGSGSTGFHCMSLWFYLHVKILQIKI